MVDKKAAVIQVLIFPLAIIPLHKCKYILIEDGDFGESLAFAVLKDGTRVRIWQGSNESLQDFMIRTGEALGNALRAGEDSE